MREVRQLEGQTTGSRTLRSNPDGIGAGASGRLGLSGADLWVASLAKRIFLDVQKKD